MGAPIRAIVLLDAQNFHAAPFFDIDLRIEREGGAFWLRLTGRDCVKQFIKSDFPEVWFK
jgi:hypothetical protein